MSSSTATLSFEFVDTLDGLKLALRDILNARQALDAATLNPHTPLLYVDVEGNDLCRHGSVSLVQLHVPRALKTFIIDIFTLGPSAFSTTVPATLADLTPSESSLANGEPFPGVNAAKGEGISLKAILESPHIIKCFFDVRNDADALYNLYGISMQSVADLQVLEVATRRGNKRLLNGLARAIRTDGALQPDVLAHWLDVKERGKALFASSPQTPLAVAPETPIEPVSSPTSPSVASKPPKPQPNFAIFDVRPLPRELLEYSVNVSAPVLTITQRPSLTRFIPILGYSE